MRRAADQQDKLGQDEVDIPGREMLGDLLLLEHKPTEALAEYRVALKLSPNRLNGLLSAGNAAEQAGLPDQARVFYRAAALATNSGANSALARVGTRGASGGHCGRGKDRVIIGSNTKGRGKHFQEKSVEPQIPRLRSG